MLGRLRMTLNQVEDAYAQFSKTVFTANRSPVDPRRRFEPVPLEAYVKSILAERNLPADQLLKDTDMDSCRVDGSPGDPRGCTLTES